MDLVSRFDALKAKLEANPQVKMLAYFTHEPVSEREIAKVEARVEAATSGPSVSTRPYVPAKPPVRPVTGSPQAADANELSDELSDDEWLRRRFAQQKASASR